MRLLLAAALLCAMAPGAFAVDWGVFSTFTLDESTKFVVKDRVETVPLDKGDPRLSEHDRSPAITRGEKETEFCEFVVVQNGKESSLGGIHYELPRDGIHAALNIHDVLFARGRLYFIYQVLSGRVVVVCAIMDDGQFRLVKETVLVDFAKKAEFHFLKHSPVRIFAQYTAMVANPQGSPNKQAPVKKTAHFVVNSKGEFIKK